MTGAHLYGIGEGMSQMQRASHIGRGDDNDKRRLPIFFGAGLEVSLLLPPIIPVPCHRSPLEFIFLDSIQMPPLCKLSSLLKGKLLEHGCYRLYHAQ